MYGGQQARRTDGHRLWRSRQSHKVQIGTDWRGCVHGPVGDVHSLAAGVVSRCLELKDPALIARLGFVGETPPIPEAGICARPGLASDVVARVKSALLAMKGPEHAAVLKNIYNIDGFVEAADADYDPVRDAVSLMGLARPK